VIDYKCSRCGEHMESPQSKAGMAERCPKCGLLNRVPNRPDHDAPAELPRAADPGTSAGPANAPRTGSIPMTAEDRPLARQLAERWIKGWPDLKLRCEKCNLEFTLAGTDGVPSLTCPSCGGTWSEEMCKYRLVDAAGILGVQLTEKLGNAPRPATVPVFEKDHPFARQFADEWFAEKPDATCFCERCHRTFRIAVAGGGASVTCPFCGFIPSEERCKNFISHEEDKAAVQLAGEMTENAQAPIGSEPPAARIQCRCSSCGALSEAPPNQSDQDEICPECGSKLTAADRLASELIAFNPDAATPCVRCKTSFSVLQSGMTCPHCGNALSERACEKALQYRRETMGDWRKIKRLGEFLSADPAGRKTPRFICPFCKSELPSLLAVRNFAYVTCPQCCHFHLYVYNGEAFESLRECERILQFRVEKSKKAKEQARARELAEAAKEIATGTHAEAGQANGGYVYALLNSTMPGLVKIGKTEREPEERAKELSNATGIATPFVVAYAERFNDCAAAEDYVHALLEQKGFRVAQNREFFCAPVKAVIQAIMKAKEREDRGGDPKPQSPV
jgi:DNA-directed RNA polymerase subunit RPC12/RpoP